MLVSRDYAREFVQHAHNEHHFRVVWTSGCFDILHFGHIRSLAEAQKLGDVLVVGLNSDASVRRLKGPKRPIFTLEERAEVLSALRFVSIVVQFDDDDPCRIIDYVRPDIVVKGEEYAPGRLPMPERDVAQTYGGRIVYTMRHTSTTNCIQRILDAYAPEVK